MTETRDKIVEAMSRAACIEAEYDPPPSSLPDIARGIRQLRAERDEARAERDKLTSEVFLSAHEVVFLRTDLAELREALTKCADQFAFYAAEHERAGKTEKAATNRAMEKIARDALAGRGYDPPAAPQADDYVTPEASAEAAKLQQEYELEARLRLAENEAEDKELDDTPIADDDGCIWF